MEQLQFLHTDKNYIYLCGMILKLKLMNQTWAFRSNFRRSQISNYNLLFVYHLL